MAITKKPVSVESFITGAPDAGVPAASLPTQRTLSAAANRGKSRSQVSVVLPDDLIQKIDAARAEAYMSRSAYIVQALRKQLLG